MADAGFNFQQWSFPLEFLNLRIFCFLSILQYTVQILYQDYFDLYGF